MKISEVTATENQVFISLEPEHPAEIALIKLMNQCPAKCDSNVDQPKDSLIITVDVKSKNSRY